MANFSNAIRSIVGVQQRNNFDLSCDNITSNDFFQFKPVYCRELVPGSSINIKLNQFTRLAPLVKPMYGSAKFVNRAFFVPFRAVYSNFNDFVSQSLPEYSASFPTFVPKCKNSFFVDILRTNFAEQNGTYSTIEDAMAVPHDFVYYTLNQTDQHYTAYKFTRKGQLAYDTLVNLGYKFNFLFNDTLTPQDEDLSLLPLMCLYKIHYDWYRLSQYRIASAIKIWNRDNFEMTSGYSYTLKTVISELLVVPYERDYFTSAWVNPNGANSSGITPNILISDASLPKLSDNDKSVVSNQGENRSGTPVVKIAPGSQVYNFSQYIDNALHHATDFIKRYQLFGSRTKDIYKSIFGIDLNDTVLNRSIHLGKSIAPVNIADVMQTATENGSGLGDYAGKGFASGNGSFSFKTDEFGMVFVISVLVPKIQYVEGLNRHCTHLSPLQFFSPDFDRLGVQAIKRSELFSENGIRDYSATLDPNGVFGFTSRYAEYKQSTTNDRLSGLFCINSLNAGRDMDVYHLSRYVNAVDDYAVTESFCTSNPTQFDRVFADQNDDSDHFITVYHFDVNCTQPMSKLYDDYEWSECDGKSQVQPLAGTMLE